MIAVIVIVFNDQRAEIDRLLVKSRESFDASDLKRKFYIIDNSNNPKFDISELKSDDVEIVESCGNIGFGPAINHIFTQCDLQNTVDAVLLLNPDGFPHRRFIAELTKGCKDLRRAILEGAQFPSEHPKNYDKETGRTPWVSGCCLLIGVAVFTELKGFDTDFFMYMEDVDFSFRATQNGIPMFYKPSALYYHVSINREDAGRNRLLTEAAYILYKKWRSKIYTVAGKQACLEQGIVVSELEGRISYAMARDPKIFRDNFRYISDDIRWKP